jgi:hypothetical protein
MQPVLLTQVLQNRFATGIGLLFLQAQSTLAQQQQELQDIKQQHANKLAEIKSQQVDAEASATSQLQQAQARLSSSSALNGPELAAVRNKAAAAAEVEAAAEAAGKKAELLKAAMQKVDQEVRLRHSGWLVRQLFRQLVVIFHNGLNKLRQLFRRRACCSL